MQRIVITQVDDHANPGKRRSPLSNLDGLHLCVIRRTENARIETVHDRMLDAANVDRFKMLALPNIAALSVEPCGQLSAYGERGGSIVAPYETSRYDEWGVKRSDLLSLTNPMMMKSPFRDFCSRVGDWRVADGRGATGGVA